MARGCTELRCRRQKAAKTAVKGQEGQCRSSRLHRTKEDERKGKSDSKARRESGKRRGKVKQTQKEKRQGTEKKCARVTNGRKGRRNCRNRRWQKQSSRAGQGRGI
jgi:hypothetical protein